MCLRLPAADTVEAADMGGRVEDMLLRLYKGYTTPVAVEAYEQTELDASEAGYWLV